MISNMKTILLILALLLTCITSSAQDSQEVKEGEEEKVKSKIITGYDGGMMLHTGYVCGNIPSAGITAHGFPFGIGGAARLHIKNHFRVGFEGYFSNLNQMGNGSYMKTFWAGAIADFYWILGKFMPYAGLSIGGGAQTTFLMFDHDPKAWTPTDGVIFQKTGFFEIDPYIGCDYLISERFHLTLKLDHMFAFGKDLQMPKGPRIYFGFVFFH